MDIKKNVGLMTLDSHTYNFGGILQEYALQRVLEELGSKCEIIDYDVTSEMNTFSMKRGLYNFTTYKVVTKIKRTLRQHKKGKNVQIEVASRKKRFDDFRKDYMKLSRAYKFPELEILQFPYDAIVCGSDQIWNPDFNIPTFFLPFVAKNVRKVIYAASIGKGTLSKWQLKVYGKYMENLDAVSVREVSAQKLLSAQYKQEIKLVLDPTLLLSGATWKEIAASNTIGVENHVFCYFLENSLEKQAAAYKYAKDRGLKIVTIPYLHDQVTSLDENFGDIMSYDAGPLEFLNYILKANTVITDSFHATVFSILFEKQFWVFGRNFGTYNMNTRLDTLLEYVEKRDKLIDPNELNLKKEEALVIKMDLIEKMKNDSIKFLVDALKLI